MEGESGAGGERPDLPPGVEALEGVESSIERGEEEGGRLRRATAAAIVIVSILAALMAWRASVAGEEAGAKRQEAQQNRLAQQQLTASEETAVAHDIDVYGSYAQRIDLARALERQARRRPAAQAASLLARAQSERRLADSQLPLFDQVAPTVRRDGSAAFDSAYALRQERLRDDERLDLAAPAELRAEAAAQHERGVHLTGLAALFVASLVLLTFAELSGRRAGRLFAASGAGVAVAALLLFATV